MTTIQTDLDRLGPQPSRPGIGSTVLPRLNLPEVSEDPVRVRVGTAARDLRVLGGAAIAGLAAGMTVGPVLGVIAMAWVPVVAYAWFVLTFTVLTSMEEDRPTVRDRFTSVLMWTAAAAVVVLLVMVVGYVFWRGQKVFRELGASHLHTFFTTDMSSAGPLAPITEGGISFAIVGTLEQIAIALIITVPLGLATAVFLNEVGGRYARLVRTIVEAMTALPAIVAGLFIYASVIALFTKEFSGFAAAIACAVLMLPIMIRSADVVLRLVPGNLREAGLALGASQWSVVRRVVLPTVRSGLTTAIILATAHGIGETAPALLTAGVTTNTNWNPFHNYQTPLTLAALEFVKSGQANLVPRGFATAATLLVLVLILFVLARMVGGQQAGQLTDAQRRRRGSRSLRQLPGIEGNHRFVAGHLADLIALQPPPADVPRQRDRAGQGRTFVTAPDHIPLRDPGLRTPTPHPPPSQDQTTGDQA